MPPWLLVVMLSSLLAALGYQILRSRPLKRVPFYWLFIVVLTVLAEVLADTSGLDSPRLGELQLFPDFLAGAIAMAILFAVRL